MRPINYTEDSEREITHIKQWNTQKSEHPRLDGMSCWYQRRARKPLKQPPWLSENYHYLWCIMGRSLTLACSDPFPQMASIVGPKPLMVARRAKNLTDEVVKSEFTKSSPHNWLTDLPPPKGIYPCGRCHICKFVERSDSFSDAKRKNTYQIKQFINCNTSRVLYMLECPCRKLYVGKTKHSLKIRIGEHLSSIRLPDDETLISEHFTKHHNGQTKGLKVKKFHALKLPNRRGDFNTILLRKEKECIFCLETLVSNGLNTELTLQVFLTP